MSSGRARKVADRIRVIVAEMLERRVKDQRLGFVTVTDVRITGDLQNASVFYTVLGDEDERAASGAALASAKGLIRSEIGRQLGMRHTPSVEFVLDALPESASHIEDLLARARASDQAVAESATNATYAGDADPYKHPDDDMDPAGLAERDGADPVALTGDDVAGPVGLTGDDVAGPVGLTEGDVAGPVGLTEGDGNR